MRELYMIVLPLVDAVVICELVDILMLLVVKRNIYGRVLRLVTCTACSVYYYFMCFEVLEDDRVSANIRHCIWLAPCVILIVVLACKWIFDEEND